MFRMGSTAAIKLFVVVSSMLIQSCATVHKQIDLNIEQYAESEYSPSDGVAVIVDDYQYSEELSCNNSACSQDRQQNNPTEFTQENNKRQDFIQTCFMEALREKNAHLNFVTIKDVLQEFKRQNYIENTSNNDWLQLFKQQEFQDFLHDHNLRYLAIVNAQHSLSAYYETDMSDAGISVNKHSKINISMTTVLYDAFASERLGKVTTHQSGTKNSGVLMILMIIPVPWVGADNVEDAICYNSATAVYNILTNTASAE